MSVLAGENTMKNGSDPEAGVSPDAHVLELTVWDVPSAIGAGERFSVVAGVRCSAGCDLGGRVLDFFDQQGAPANSVKLGRDVWPGTEALYFAEVEAHAPLEAGTHQWTAKVAGWDGESPHAAGSFAVTVRTVTAPDCEITLQAVDRESHTPISGARVVMHPYRAVTDEDGIARMKVAKGQYDILVSGFRYIPACTSFEVSADMLTTVELDADQPDEDQE
jgi:hypothetical protein